MLNGGQMLEAKKFESIRELNGISFRTMSEHYKLYEGYIKKFNEISSALESVDSSLANQAYSAYRALKLEYSFALSGVKNHELYFSVLGGSGSEPKNELMSMLERDFGSFANWRKDFVATGMAARGWAFLVYDLDLKKLVNHLGDSQNTYSVWNSSMILAMDVYEHAYFIDYGAKRADYIESFFNNLDWSVVEERLNRLNIR